MSARHIAIGALAALPILVVGIVIGRTWPGGQPFVTDPASDAEALRDRCAILEEERDAARKAANRWKQRAEILQSRRVIAGAADRAAKMPTEAAISRARDAIGIRDDLATAMQAGDGLRVLQLLAEMAALGDTSHPEVARGFGQLVNMSSSDLERLGLSRIDLSSALVQLTELMRHVLDEPSLDPGLRRFTAQTLAQARLSVRRSILDTQDFSTEKDRQVVASVVRAVQDVRDPAYVDRFLNLVQRTDLYNGMRHSVAFMIAEIDGAESAEALRTLRQSGNYKRIVPVLDNIHAPPATGLLVTNGMSPTADRIGLNDVVLEYNGRRIATNTDLAVADAETKPGQVVPVKLLRDGDEIVIQVTVTNTAPGHLHFDGRAIEKR